MKRNGSFKYYSKIAVLALAIAGFMAIVLSFQYRQDAKEPFGYADRVYGLNCFELDGESSYFTSIRSCGIGRTDSETSGNTLSLVLIPADGKHLLLGENSDLPNVSFCDFGDHAGKIEKIVDDEWQYVCEVTRSGTYTAQGRADGYWALDYDDNPNIPNFIMGAPIFENPGRYRVTLEFHELEKRGNTYRRDSKPHFVSFQLTVPDYTSARFDIVDVGILQSGNYPCFQISLRSNDGSAHPFIDSNLFEVSHVSGNTTTHIKQDGDAIVLASDNGAWGSSDIGVYSLMGINIPIDEFDTSGKYVVKIGLSSNPDGSGERYTLTLNLRFEE